MCSPKAKGNLTHIRQDRGQFLTSVPKALVLALGLRPGDLLEWRILSPEELRVRILRKEEPCRSS